MRLNNRKTKVLITIDTEFSMGGYFRDHKYKPVPADRIIYCKIAGKEYGINLIMDILEEFDLKGNFFVETEARFYFGDDVIAEIINDIRSRGHEIHLHIHPTFRSFINNSKMLDDMRQYSLDQQTKMISDALRFLFETNITRVFAYRSGGFYGNMDTIRAAQLNGIPFSSNYNLAVPNCRYIEEFPLRNDIFHIRSGWEIPITCYKEIPVRKAWNPFQICAASFREIRRALEYYYRLGLGVITFITHSFEFVKAHDIQYRSVSPRALLIRRFQCICSYLNQNADKYEVITFGDLYQMVSEKEIEVGEKTGNCFYRSSLFNTVERYVENRFMSSSISHKFAG